MTVFVGESDLLVLSSVISPGDQSKDFWELFGTSCGSSIISHVVWLCLCL